MLDGAKLLRFNKRPWQSLESIFTKYHRVLEVVTSALDVESEGYLTANKPLSGFGFQSHVW